MDQQALRFIEVITQANSALGYCVLALSAFLEYVFPPFPGDTVTLFGAFLITARGWSFAGVFAVVLAGSAAGSLADFWLGKAIGRRRARRPSPAAAGKLEILVERFRRHGAWYLALNRFLPGIRALFFVAAGLAGLPAHRVLFWSLVSAALWNLGLIAVGSLVGENLEALRRIFSAYALVVWTALVVAALAWLVVWLVRRRR